jgi:hypothetical protein
MVSCLNATLSRAVQRLWGATRNQHDVPTITTITASVRGDVTDMPDTILWWRGNEMGRAPTINADNRW